MSQKFLVTPQQLQILSFKLGMNIYESQFKPEFLVALWRGGATPAKHIHEVLMLKGLEVDHVAIRTSKYTDIDTANQKVMIHNLTYLIERIKPNSKLLIVDDIHDTGDSIFAFKEKLTSLTPINLDNVKVATIYHKPSKNRYSQGPQITILN